MSRPDVNSVPSNFFQLALSSQVVEHASGLASDKLGELVTDIKDVDQCIRVILSTPKGSIPHRILFGSDVHLLVDHPVNVARPHIVREVIAALREWEPRVEVLKVTVSLASLSALECVIDWQFVNDVANDVFVTNIALRSYQ